MNPILEKISEAFEHGLTCDEISSNINAMMDAYHKSYFSCLNIETIRQILPILSGIENEDNFYNNVNIGKGQL